MFSPPQIAEPVSLHTWLLQKQNAFRKAYEFVRRNASAQQHRALWQQSVQQTCTRSHN